MVLSSWSTTSMEEVAAAAVSGLRWFQLYVYKDRALTEDLVCRAAASGYKALCVTIDTPVLGKRREDMRHGFDLPSHLRLANFRSEHLQSSLAKGKTVAGSALFQYTQKLICSSLTWKDIKWLQDISLTSGYIPPAHSVEGSADSRGCQDGRYAACGWHHGVQSRCTSAVMSVSVRCTWMEGCVRGQMS